MIGVDTNILVRFLVNDDLVQAQRVRSFFRKVEEEGDTLFISDPVILELLYVLDSVYGYNRMEILGALESMLSVGVFIFENHDLLADLVVKGRNSTVELEGLFIGIIARHAGCSATITYDKKAAGSKLFTLLR